MTASPLEHPEFLPFKLDLVGQRVLWVRLDDGQRRGAAFLDERALPQDAEGGWLPLQAWLQRNEPAPARPADAIFHIGHCGSTLLSRLLESWPDVQVLREPLPLRTLAEAWLHHGQPEARLSTEDADRVLQAAWAAWSRPLPPHVRAVVKATSSCNALIEPLLVHCPSMRTVLLDMPLRPYLATLLKSPGSVHDAASAATGRVLDLHARGLGDGVALHALSLPEQCAMGWLAERIRFDALARSEHSDRVLRVDFERLLADPEPTLRSIAAHLALDPAHLPAALASPVWQRYSKAEAHGYGRDDRAHDLAVAMRKHASEIAEAEAWVDGFLERHPVLVAVIGG